MKHLISTLLISLLAASTCFAQTFQPAEDAVQPDWQSEVPQPVYPDTALVNLYYHTWQIASGRVRRGPEGLPVSPYLDENCYEDQIWIWDTCLMSFFARYAPRAFPALGTLDNCYLPLHEHQYTPLRIHLRDNPPLFAWAEWESYLHLADTARAKRIVADKRFLQRHYEWFDTVRADGIDTLVSPAYNPIFHEAKYDSTGNLLGYTWQSRACGMDNTPRGRGIAPDSLLWVDAISQQALSARCIAKFCHELGLTEEQKQWERRYDTLRQTVNQLYWDEKDGIYYDITLAPPHTPCRVLTPASLWPLLAGIPSQEQAKRMLKYVREERYMGGIRPFTSVSRSDKDHDALTGNYWRGGIWLPVAYMGIKALEQYGYTALADSLAQRIVSLQLRTFQHYAPHTIWECYSPSADEPSTEYGERCRPDFCGWSALGPISLFIENILGFRQTNGVERALTWTLRPEQGTYGIRRLHIGEAVASIVYNAQRSRIETESTLPFHLCVNEKWLNVEAGIHTYKYRTH